MAAGLAAADQAGGQAAFRVGPHRDVGQTGVAERRGRIAAERPEPLGPEHVSGAPAQRREPVRDVGAQATALLRRGAQRLRPHDAHAVEFAAAHAASRRSGTVSSAVDTVLDDGTTPVRNCGVFANGMICCIVPPTAILKAVAIGAGSGLPVA